MSPGKAEFWRHRDLGIEHIAASFPGRRFPAHAHDTYLIGLTVEGAEELVQSGRRHVSRAGQVRLINPFELHEGGAAGDQPWAYEAIYVPAAVMTDSAAGEPVLFTSAVVDDPPVSEALRRLFVTLRGCPEPLERQSRFTDFAAGALANYIGRPAAAETWEPLPVRRVRDHLHAHAMSRVTLDQLSAEAGLSKFHLLRVFKAQTGFTPWQYQAHLRIEAAKRLLRTGEPPSHVADACGFVDQSHFTRVFRTMLGITPATYAAGHRRFWAPGR